MPHHHHVRRLPMFGPAFHDPVVTDAMRADAFAKTAEVMAELDKVRKRLELKPEQLELVCDMYAGVLSTMISAASTKAYEDELAKATSEGAVPGVGGAWQNLVGGNPLSPGGYMGDPMPFGGMPRPLLSEMRETPRDMPREILPVNSTAYLCPECSARHPGGGRSHDTDLPYKVKPGERVRVSARPQRVAFKPDRLTIQNGERWIVHDFKIGNRSQFSQSGDIPGEFFDAKNVDTMVTFETAQTAMDVTFEVTYIGPEKDGEQFRAQVIGRAAV